LPLVRLDAVRRVFSKLGVDLVDNQEDCVWSCGGSFTVVISFDINFPRSVLARCVSGEAVCHLGEVVLPPM
jgi:hypothetical protein